MQSGHVHRAILFFGLALVFQIETLLVAPRSDSAAWLFMGQRQAHGQMPSRDLWDNKLPLIYLIGRAAMASGRPQLFLWLLEAAVTAMGALAVCAMVRMVPRATDVEDVPVLRKNLWHRRLAGGATGGTPVLQVDYDRRPHCATLVRGGASPDRAAVCAGVLFCIVSGAPSFHGGGFLTEVYAMPLSAVAAYLSCRGIRQPSRASVPIAAGLLWTLAVSFRLPLGMAALTVIGSLAVARRMSDKKGIEGPPEGRAGRYLALHLMGAVVGGLLVLAHPMATGYLTECLRAAVLWPLGAVTGRAPGPLSASTPARLADFAQDIAKLGWLHIAAVGGLAVAIRHGPRLLAIVVAVWYAAALASAALGWASYAHYQYVAFAPMAVAFGFLIIALEARTARKTAAVLIGITAVVVGVQNARGLLHARPGSDEADRAAVVSFVGAQTEPTDGVLIWAWGRSADLLYRIGRPPGQRHFLAHAYLDMDASLFNEMTADFLVRPPAWIVEDAHRNNPPLTSAPRTDWSWSSPALQRLQSFVRDRYTQEARFGRYLILRFDGAAPTVSGSSPNDSVGPAS